MTEREIVVLDDGNEILDGTLGYIFRPTTPRYLLAVIEEALVKNPLSYDFCIKVKVKCKKVSTKKRVNLVTAKLW